MSKRNWALLAALGATTIYGLNHTIAKGAMPDYVGPFGFIMLRLGGATRTVLGNFSLCSQTKDRKKGLGTNFGLCPVGNGHKHARLF